MEAVLAVEGTAVDETTGIVTELSVAASMVVRERVARGPSPRDDDLSGVVEPAATLRVGLGF